jgi:hypothetical protein
MHQIVQPVSIADPRPAEEENVAAPRSRMNRRTPQVNIARRRREHPRLFACNVDRIRRSRSTGRLTKKVVRRVGQINGYPMRDRILLQTSASGSLVDIRNRRPLTGKGRLKDVHDFVGPDEVMLHDQHGGDRKSEALRNPEAEKYLGEKPSHRLSFSREFALRRHRELIPNAADGLDPLAEIVGRVQLVPQPAHVHIKTAIKGMKLPSQHGLC